MNGFAHWFGDVCINSIFWTSVRCFIDWIRLREVHIDETLHYFSTLRWSIILSYLQLKWLGYGSNTRWHWHIASSTFDMLLMLLWSMFFVPDGLVPNVLPPDDVAFIVLKVLVVVDVVVKIGTFKEFPICLRADKSCGGGCIFFCCWCMILLKT